MKPVQSPHDKFFRKTFGDPAHARAFLEGMLPPGLQQLVSLETLEISKDSYVDEDLQDSYSDLVIQTNLQLPEAEAPTTGYLYLLFEHKSYQDPLAGFQLMKYMCRIWEDDLAKRGAREKSKPMTDLVPILPLVIYHGNKAWETSTQFQDLVLGAKDEALQPYTPHWKYQLYDLSQYTDDQIREVVQDRIFQNVLLVLRDSRNEDLSLILRHLTEAVKAVLTLSHQYHPTEYLHTLIVYLWEVRDDLPGEIIKKIIDQVHPGRSDEIMTIAEKLRQEGMEKGKQEVLIKLLSTKFGSLPAEIERKIYMLEDQKLEELVTHIFEYQSLEDVRERLH